MTHVDVHYLHVRFQVCFLIHCLYLFGGGAATFSTFLLFYLFTLINVDALLRRLAAELTAIERVPRVNHLRVIREIRSQYSRCRSVAEADVEGRQLAGGGNIVIGMVVIVVFRVADGHAREYGLTRLCSSSSSTMVVTSAHAVAAVRSNMSSVMAALENNRLIVFFIVFLQVG